MAVGYAVAGPAATFSTVAAPLEKAECDALKQEQERLVAAGARANMTRGPEWARHNLAADKIAHIERLIQVDEQIAFRCPQPKPAVEPAEKVDQAAKKPGRDPAKAGSAEAAAQKAAAPQAPPASVAPKKAKAKPAPAKAAEGAAPQTPVAAPAPNKEVRKSKPVPDAFSPAAAAKAGTGEAAPPAR